MNESITDFSETLWAEHKYGKDEGDAFNHQAMMNYFNSPDAYNKDRVRFFYHDKEDTFDTSVTYYKGGRILNMLRKFLGEEAFFKGLNVYLKTNALKAAEAHQLRLAMEEVSGLDLNWFFNQWYFGAGHPVLNISYKWDSGAKTQTVYLKQTQPGQPFILLLAVDIYSGGKKQRHQVWMNNRANTVTFQMVSRPDLVNVDGDKALLAQISDSKSLQELEFQFFNAKSYVDRLEAIDSAINHQGNKSSQKILIAALNDNYYGLRIKAINALDMNNTGIRTAAIPVLIQLARYDHNTLARAAAINVLGDLKRSDNVNLFRAALKSPSYAVQSAGLYAIGMVDSVQALHLAQGFETDNKGELTKAMIKVYSRYGNSNGGFLSARHIPALIPMFNTG